MLDQIPTIPKVDWYTVYQQAIVECGEQLVNLKESQYSSIKTLPIYYQQNIQHALPECYVRKTVAQRLQFASTCLPEGYHLLVLDGWRPYSLQQQLVVSFREHIMQKDPQMDEAQIVEILSLFVAQPSQDPSRPSPHLTGGAVDLTLCDNYGVPLNMGTDFDEPTEDSWTASFEQDKVDLTVKYNRRLLYWTMRKAGFTNLPTEWWHYDYGDQLWCYFSRQEHAVYSKIAI